MKLYLALCASTILCEKITHKEASAFLRVRRANELLSEYSEGNMERECIEELCDHEEAREIFEDRTDEFDAFWEGYMKRPDMYFTPPVASEEQCTLVYFSFLIFHIF